MSELRLAPPAAPAPAPTFPLAGMAASTDYRMSEAQDRPDIACWENQRAADVVRRGIAHANATYALEAGTAVTYRPAGLAVGIAKRNAPATLVGWLGRNPVLRIAAADRGLDYLTGRAYLEDWQGIVGPCDLTRRYGCDECRAPMTAADYADNRGTCPACARRHVVAPSWDADLERIGDR